MNCGGCLEKHALGAWEQVSETPQKPVSLTEPEKQYITEYFHDLWTARNAIERARIARGKLRTTGINLATDMDMRQAARDLDVAALEALQLLVQKG
jgi:hypothetical protein